MEMEVRELLVLRSAAAARASALEGGSAGVMGVAGDCGATVSGDSLRTLGEVRTGSAPMLLAVCWRDLSAPALRPSLRAQYGAFTAMVRTLRYEKHPAQANVSASPLASVCSRRLHRGSRLLSVNPCRTRQLSAWISSACKRQK